jgi:hypothetical protein
MEDLQKERDATTEVVNTLRQVPIRAEYFIARRENPVEVCIKEATECSVYIGIFKERYGSVPDTDNPRGLSVTALEYEAANNAGRDIKIFISEDKTGRQPELTRFLDTVIDPRHWRKTYANVLELKYLVATALSSEIIRHYQTKNAKGLDQLVSLDDTLLSTEFTGEYADIGVRNVDSIVLQVIKGKRNAEAELRE